MKRTIAAILTFLMIVFISIIPMINIARAVDITLTLSDAELGTQFAYEWGPSGSGVTITDISGLGVLFGFTGLSTSGTAVGDDFPVSQLAGGAADGIGGWGDFRAYTRYRLVFTNLGPDPVSVGLFMNTGYGALPNPKDTYWENGWIYIETGKSKIVTLDFSSATAWNAQDDPITAWQYSDGTSGVIVRRLSEVSNIGFQVCGSGAGSLVVSSTTPSDAVLILPDEELETQFAKVTGPGTLTAITELSGLGVCFEFTGLDASTGTIVSDNFPLSALAGGAWKDYGSGFAGPYDFSTYSRFVLLFRNAGTSAVTVSLIMNTGWTGSPWGSSVRDTFWKSNWISLDPGESAVAILDFWNAEVWNAADDPTPAWQYPDGTSGVIVQRLDEVSNIGFQVLGTDGASIIVSGQTTITLFDAELSTQLTKETGPGTLAATTDIPGPGVKFDFTGLTTDVGTVVGDNFPVSALAGGAYKTYGVTNPFSTWGDFFQYTSYALVFTNIGLDSITINLKMNTGWTIPPPEYAAMWRDTFWQGPWTTIAPGETKTISMNLSYAEVYNAVDEQEYPSYPDGTPGVAVWRLDEVSDLGFQVLGDGDASIIVGAQEPIHDVAITNVTALPSAVTVGNTVTITATAANLGAFSESFFVTAYYDGNAIGVQAVTNLSPASNTVLVFSWDTTGMLTGTYTIKAEAGTVSAETGTANNVFVDGTVQINPSPVIHDVAITSVISLVNETYQGWIEHVNATVENLGTATESFIVTLYYNSTIIDTKSVSNLLPAASITLNYAWNTTGVPVCHNYTIRAVASGIPGETNTANNVLSNGMIHVKLAGDINGDGYVNGRDGVLLGLAFTSRPGDPSWNPQADFNRDTFINAKDAVVLGSTFGTHCP
jgi:hypothetical protein